MINPVAAKTGFGDYWEASQWDEEVESKQDNSSWKLSHGSSQRSAILLRYTVSIDFQ
jgi:hypothetical protein